MRILIAVAALTALAACGSGQKTCDTEADCPAGWNCGSLSCTCKHCKICYRPCNTDADCTALKDYKCQTDCINQYCQWNPL